jgi:hypothetical protein
MPDYLVSFIVLAPITLLLVIAAYAAWCERYLSFDWKENIFNWISKSFVGLILLATLSQCQFAPY